MAAPIELLHRAVPCAGCTACCRQEMIVLHPENGDDPRSYRTRRVRNPLNGKPVQVLLQRKAGACIYLDDARGCRIYDRRPVICRGFDCRRFFNQLVKDAGLATALKVAAREPVVSQGARLVAVDVEAA